MLTRQEVLDLIQASHPKAGDVRNRRLQEEALRIAASERPHLLTSFALTDMAMSLSQYELPDLCIQQIQQQQERGEVEGRGRGRRRGPNINIHTVDKEQVLRHHLRVIASSSSASSLSSPNNNNNDSNNTTNNHEKEGYNAVIIEYIKKYILETFPSSIQLVSLLDDLLENQKCLQNYKSNERHTNIDNEDDVIISHHLEVLLHEVVRDGSTSALILGLVSVLGVMMMTSSSSSYYTEENNNDECEVPSPSRDENEHLLRVGSILSLLPVDDDDDDVDYNGKSLSTTVLNDLNFESMQYEQAVNEYERILEEKRYNNNDNSRVSEGNASVEESSSLSSDDNDDDDVDGPNVFVPPEVSTLQNSAIGTDTDADTLNRTEPHAHGREVHLRSDFEIDAFGSSSDEADDDDDSESDTSFAQRESGEVSQFDEEYMIRQALALSMVECTVDEQSSRISDEEGPRPEEDPSETIDKDSESNESSIYLRYETTKREKSCFGVSFYDAGNFNEFSSVPINQVFVHLLKAVLCSIKNAGQINSEVALESAMKPRIAVSESPGDIIFLVSILRYFVVCRSDALEFLSSSQAIDVALIDFPDNDEINENDKETEDPANNPMVSTSMSPQASNTYESFASKGMLRKAAAAADFLNMHQDRSDHRYKKIVERIEFTSYSLFLLLQILRYFFIGSFESSILQGLIGDFFTISKTTLLECIETLYDEKLSETFQALLLLEKGSLAIDLRECAFTLWSILTPYTLLGCNDAVELISNFIDKSVKIRQNEAKVKSDGIIPWSRKLRVSKMTDALCIRFRRSDMLGLYFDPNSEGFHCGAVIKLIEKLSETRLKACEFLNLAIIHRLNQAISFNSRYNSSQLVDTTIGSSNVSFISEKATHIFDITRCSESIAIKTNQSGIKDSAALQRATKVWGTCVSAVPISPRTGIHHFAVRLDKCEKGHIFVGVTTSNASVKTYIGGDSFGWGMIGTQALWHDRRKVKTDYGSIFQTGNVILVTCDTDSGTLKFGLLRPIKSVREGDHFDSRAYELEDWGIAFVGLPLNSTLFPSVALYQRDDKVSFVEPIHPDARNYSSRFGVHLPVQFNKNALTRVLEFVSAILGFIKQKLRAENECSPAFRQILSSTCASLAMIPNVREFGVKFAINLLGPLSDIVSVLDGVIEQESLFQVDVHGKWNVNAVPNEGSQNEEYTLTIQPAFNDGESYSCEFDGSGVGIKGRCVDDKVSVNGFVQGSRIRFVETWQLDKSESQESHESCCLIDARFNLQGDKFEGHYQMEGSKKMGKIFGSKDCLLNKYLGEQHVEVLVCSAISRLASFFGCFCDYLSNNTVSDQLMSCINKATFSKGMVFNDDERVSLMRNFLGKYGIVLEEDVAYSYYSSKHIEPLVRELDTSKLKADDVDRLDAWIASHRKSVFALKAEGFEVARKNLVLAIIQHCELDSSMLPVNYGDEFIPPTSLLNIWSSATTILEGNIRKMIPSNSLETAIIRGLDLSNIQSTILTRVKAAKMGLPLESVLDSISTFCRLANSAEVLASLEELFSFKMITELMYTMNLNSIYKVVVGSRGKTRNMLQNLAAIEALFSFWPITLNIREWKRRLCDRDFALEFCERMLMDIIEKQFHNISLRDSLTVSDVSAIFTFGPIIMSILRPSQLSYFSNTTILKSLNRIMTNLRSSFIESGPKYMCLGKNELFSIVWAISNFCVMMLLEELDIPRPSRVEIESLFCQALMWLKDELVSLLPLLEDLYNSASLKEQSDLANAQVCLYEENFLSLKKEDDMLDKQKTADSSERTQLLLNNPLNKNSRFSEVASVESYFLSIISLFEIVARKRTEFSQLLVKIGICDVLLENEEILMWKASRSFVPIKVFRLLRHLLLSRNADAEIASQLFRIIGQAFRFKSEIGDEADVFIPEDLNWIILREAVSLVRFLILYSQKKSMHWSYVIEEIVTSHFVLDKKFSLKNGIPSEFLAALLVLGGLPQHLSVGSYVYLTEESKGSSYQIQRAEEIANSLSGGKSLVGVISSYDISGARNEVTLFDEYPILDPEKTRERTEKKKWSDFDESFSDKIPELLPVSTVYAKTSDIAPICEFPVPSLLVPIRSLDQMMQGALAFLEDLINGDGHLLDVSLRHLPLLILRTSIVILSNRDSFEKLLSFESASVPLLMKIAALPETKSLSKLGSCESNYLSCLSSLEKVNQMWLAIKCSDSILDEPVRLDGVRKNDFTSDDSSSKSKSGNEDEDNDHDHGEVDEAEEESVSASDTQSTHIEQSHLSEDEMHAAIAQMVELGLPSSWAEFALRQIDSANVEDAVHYCLERGADMERLVLSEQERLASRNTDEEPTRNRQDSTNLRQLLDMGFPSHWCTRALAATDDNVNEALNWILVNGHRLSDVDNSDIAEEDVDDDTSELNEENSEKGDSSTDQKEEADLYVSDRREKTEDTDKSFTDVWTGPLFPIQFVSGNANIDDNKLVISGLASGGFTSVGTKGILHVAGKWYYEVELITSGCVQIGWASGAFCGHCQADRGDGVGDGTSSWAYDGWRRYKWHQKATEWGCRWQAGDIVGCLVDMDNKSVSFTLNGEGEEIGMGVAFSGDGFRPCGGVFACCSFNKKEKIRIILGNENTGNSFVYGPPPGYRAVAGAVVDAADDLNILMNQEDSLLSSKSPIQIQRALCDFSDCDHGHELFSWQHRYYGSDASVHLAGKSREKNKADSKQNSLQIIMISSFKNLSELDDVAKGAVTKSAMKKIYLSASTTLQTEIMEEIIRLCTLYSRKLLLQALVLRLDVVWSANDYRTDSLWAILNSCCSVSNGWAGEAGSMAIAASSLGLGITTADVGAVSNLSIRSNIFQSCMNIAQDNLLKNAENSIVGRKGGSIVFLKEGLQSICSGDKKIRDVLVAGTRRIVRELAVVVGKDNRKNEEESEEERSDGSHDPHLAQFITGLLLSEPVWDRMNEEDKKSLTSNLFEAWSIGLLSSSMPFRMICAMTCTGILNIYPCIDVSGILRLKTLCNFFNRLQSYVNQRLFAERAAFPVASKYLQAIIELLGAVKASSLTVLLKPISYDAGTPLPLNLDNQENGTWESTSSFVSSDEGWIVLFGSLKYLEVDWMTPARSTLRSLMDEGEGPPMLKAGCQVLRGQDWVYDNDDGRSEYLAEKSRREDLREESGDVDGKDSTDEPNSTRTAKKKKKKTKNPKLPVGTVISIEPWNGVPALGRKVTWHRTGITRTYRYGGAGGRFDLQHVEVNEKETKVKKRHIREDSSEQIVSRNGFGIQRSYNVILRICLATAKSSGSLFILDGVLELPDFCAGIQVQCTLHNDNALSVKEERLIYGSKSCGWEARFGAPEYTPGTVMTLKSESQTSNPTSAEGRDVSYELLVGTETCIIQNIFNKENGERVRLESEMILLCPRDFHSELSRKHQSKTSTSTMSFPPTMPLTFDKDYHSRSIHVSCGGKTASCNSSDSRCIAFGSVGFTKGVHYWEIKIEKANTGSIFIGVAEKPNPTSNNLALSNEPPRLGRWLGWGFVNFRATYSGGVERVYGSHCHDGDTIGLLLDCDAGRISFFYDGMKYGEHILNDLGPAFCNISSFGFNADGCGNGGAAQGAPSALDIDRTGRYSSNGVVRPRTLWPVIGFRTKGDKVSFNGKWMSSLSVDSGFLLQNALLVDEILRMYDDKPTCGSYSIPDWLLKESWTDFQSWRSAKHKRVSTRAGAPLASLGLDVDLDTTPFSCAVACATLGLKYVLLPGDSVKIRRSLGRSLELPEIGQILGAYNGRLFYKLISQKTEGGSLVEGGGRAWFLDENEVEGNGIEVVSTRRGLEIELPLIERFACNNVELKIVFTEGAIIRSRLEIEETSAATGTIPLGEIIGSEYILDCRMNSSNILRYRVRYNGTEGWISSRTRCDDEVKIVERCYMEKEDPYTILTPKDAALIWMKKYSDQACIKNEECILSHEDFKRFIQTPLSNSWTMIQSNSIVVEIMNILTSFSPSSSDAQDISFTSIFAILGSCLQQDKDEYRRLNDLSKDDFMASEAIKRLLTHHNLSDFSIEGLMARMSLLRIVNKRVQCAFPLLLVKPPQEQGTIFGGELGFGATPYKVGQSVKAMEKYDWMKAPSTGHRLRNCKKVLFRSSKMAFFNTVVFASTTPTPLSHDEYELPRDIRTVHVNRVKSRRAQDIVSQRKNSIFSQLKKEMRGWSGAWLRRGFIAKGHGGQKRAFKVKFVSEGVNDYSGPYREVFTDIVREVHQIKENSGFSILNILEPSPNNQHDMGNLRDDYIFCHKSTDELHEAITLGKSAKESEIVWNFYKVFMSKSDRIREIEDNLVFLGKLIGTACRHGIAVDLQFSDGLVWKNLTEEPQTVRKVVNEVDALSNNLEDEGLQFYLNQKHMLNSFAEGLSSVLPVELFPIFTCDELKTLFCGHPKGVDISLLSQVVEYEGYNGTEDVISYLWETLWEMSDRERKLFLQFVWARSCLPFTRSDFELPFKVVRDTVSNPDTALPSASTCFFSLTLPSYSSKSILKDKLVFAIENVCTMESDYVTNDVEIEKGWKD